jgi:hypothetical protein
MIVTVHHTEIESTKMLKTREGFKLVSMNPEGVNHFQLVFK